MQFTKVPEVMLKGGEWLTPDGVLRWVSSACTLDDAAIRACNRTPVTMHEWREFFRFYLLHFEGILGQYVSYMLDHQEIMSVNAFWLLVFKKVFPPGMIYQAFSQALQLYPMWAEAGGLDRWDQITRLIIAYQEMCSGKAGHELENAIHQRMYWNLEQVISSCPTRQC